MPARSADGMEGGRGGRLKLAGLDRNGVSITFSLLIVLLIMIMCL